MPSPDLAPLLPGLQNKKFPQSSPIGSRVLKQQQMGVLHEAIVRLWVRWKKKEQDIGGHRDGVEEGKLGFI